MLIRVLKMEIPVNTTCLLRGAKRMRFLRLLSVFTMMPVFAMAQAAAGQGRGAGAAGGEQRAPARAGIQSTTNLMGLMEMSVAGFADGSDIPIRYSQAVRTLPAHPVLASNHLDQRPGGYGELRFVSA